MFKFVRWHSGFNYFTGYIDGEKVFIKVCAGKWNTVPAEAFLSKFPSFTAHPLVLDYEYKPFSWIATKFINTTAIDRVDSVHDINQIVNQMANILDELKENGIVHRDLRPENICIDENENVIIIDFGWAVYRTNNWEKTQYEFIEKILNQQYRNQDDKFDDALSAYLSFKAAFQDLDDEKLKPIKDRIGALTI